MEKLIKEKTANAEKFLLMALKNHKEGNIEGMKLDIKWAEEQIILAGRFIRQS